jgi:hypothetical protein
MKTLFLMLILIAAGSSAWARPHRAYDNSGQTAWGESSHIDCQTVWAYVGQVGLVQARALARASGMTASQEWRARQCLARRD